MLINKTIPPSYIFSKIKREIIYVLIMSIIVFVITTKYNSKLPEMPLTIPTFIGTAISILLSFRLNQSYDRWWEARKAWGSIVNDSRSLIIQLKTLTLRGNDAIIRKIAFRQIAWCYSLGQSLRGLDALAGLEEFVSEEELAKLKLHQNKPLSLLNLNGMDIKKLKEENQLEIFSQVQLDGTLVRLCEAQGKVERIKNTVFPVTYRIFLHMIIYLFVITLSISLRNVSAFFELPLLLVISSAFFLLERSSTHMQDPFENRPTDTAVTSIARNIEINIKQLLNESNVPEPLLPQKFYIL